MTEPMRWVGQLAIYAALAAFVGYFSYFPTYEAFDEDAGVVKLSFSHGGARKVDCRRLTTDEIAALPPNERRPNTCTRERVAVYVEMAIDGEVVYSESIEARGIAKDGPAAAYAKIVVPTGTHRLRLGMRDSTRASGFDYEHARTLTIERGRIFVVDFDAPTGQFLFPSDANGSRG